MSLEGRNMLDIKMVGTRISSFRKKNELSQEQLAELLHLSPQAVSKWENGHSLPNTSILPALAQIFNCTIDELIMPAYSFDPLIEENKPNILEIQAEHIAKSVLEKIEKAQTINQIPGLSDQEIIRAITKSNPNISNLKIHRSAQQKRHRFTDIYVTAASPQKEFKLLERIYSGDDRELKMIRHLQDQPSAIPHTYHINLPERILLVEDLNDSYIQGFCYDEHNENGDFFRENYNALLEATAKFHSNYWEDDNAFSEVGIDWRHESIENLETHLSGMECDFLNYKEKEENNQIPQKWECFENNLDIANLNYFQDALHYMKQVYPDILQARFGKRKNVTVIHGDLHPGNTFMAKTPDHAIKFIDFQAVRIGLCTEDLAMLLALHIEPDKSQALPLLEVYYQYLSKAINGYSYDQFMEDYKLSIMEAMFFPIRLINQGIYDFSMRDRAIQAYETFVVAK